MIERARVVVIGSGICGSSVAYHLTDLGWRDVCVLEGGELCSGTTSHAPGLVGQLRSNASLTRILMNSVALYRGLRAGGAAGYFEVGSLRLASSRERLEELKRQAGFARALGLAAEIVSAAEAKRRFPLMSTRGVEGALLLPTDGSARAPVLAQALREAASGRGATFVPRTPVEGFDLRGGRVRAVQTASGRIETENVVVAAGIWSPLLGRLAGVAIPLVPMQHQYAATEPLRELQGDVTLANLRDPDLLVYLRQDGDRLVLGGYEHDPAPFDPEEIPRTENPTVRPFDPPRFAPLLRGAVERVPVLEGARFAKEVNGLESFTPDGEFILGEAAGVRGFWVACGFCAHGVSGSGGIGRALAEWIVAGEPSLDLWHMDVRRFGAHASSRRWVRERAAEVYRTYYAIGYPGEERKSARGLRLSPLYGRLKELGAVFGEKGGWERPNWFQTNERLAAEAAHAGRGWPEPRGWARRAWSSAIGAEHEAARTRVALFDETSFAKIEVSGPGALAFLERLAANRLDRPAGSVTYTQLCNEHGGIECDLTVTRLADDRFQLVTGTLFGAHDLSWIRRHLPADGSAAARDVTSSLACIGVWGPRARDLMQAASEDDFTNAGFPYLTARRVTVGEVPVLALRVTYVGELGWELYAPMEYGLRLWDTLWEAGKPFGAAAAGYRAIDSLRLEKGYRYWSADIHSEYNPYEAGLGFAVKLDKGDFIGRGALERARREGVRRKLCCLTLAEPAAVVLGGEPILHAGKVAGRVTSGGYGYTVRRSIAYGYLPVELAAPGTAVDVELFGERLAAEVAREPLHDPRGEKIKS
jgi:4-methylaminobutanoate oxidase (formaldehyde-forming)